MTAMPKQNLQQLKVIVHEILKTDEQTRNSDSLLYLRVLERVSKDADGDAMPLSMTVAYFLTHMKDHGFPPFESVRRARQKAQVEDPDLKACEKVEAMRRENEAEYKSFALQKERSKKPKKPKAEKAEKPKQPEKVEKPKPQPKCKAPAPKKEKPQPQEVQKKVTGRHSQKVKHLETGKIYSDTKAAAMAIGGTYAGLNKHLSGKAASYKGQHFAYTSKHNFSNNNTLCWQCANAFGGCCWTGRDEHGVIQFQPVPGWNAEPTMIAAPGGKILLSYCVFQCPEFVPDRPNGEGCEANG